VLPSPTVRFACSCALIAATAGLAHADVRDTFGLAKSSQDKPIDCHDGLDFGCAGATDPLANDAAPFAISTWLPAAYLLTLPTASATHDVAASYVTGVGRDDAGPSIAGGNGLENRWTIDGAPADSVRTGAVDTKVPLTFLDGILVQTGGFAARDRVSTGGTIDARLKEGGDHFELDVRGWASWTGEPRHTPTVANTYQLRTGTLDPGPTATASIVADGPLPISIPGARTWWVAGIAPTITSTTLGLDAKSLTDVNGDGVPDGLPGLVSTVPIESSRTRIGNYAVPMMLRAGVDGAVQHLALTAIGSVSSSTQFQYNATPQAGAVDTTNFVGDAIATYRAETGDTKFRVQGAWHRSMQDQSARYPAAANIPQTLSAYVPPNLADDPGLSAKCTDGTPSDPFPGFVQCPIPVGWFESGGAGELTNTRSDRGTLTADVAHRFGNNVVRVGATGEDSQLVTHSSFTGGEQELSLFPGENDVRKFVSQSATCSTDISVPCPYVDVSELAYRTIYGAAYVEDTWKAAPAIQIDGGLRWELMWVGPALHDSNELAPRLGASWDFLGGGRSRAWVSMGRSFALLPAGLGSTILVRDRFADELTFGGATTRSVDTGAPQTVVDGIEPVTQDELTSGVEVALNRVLRVRTYLQYRTLRYGIESTAEGFDNPGRLGGEPALRDTRLFAFEVSTALDAASMLRVGWAWGETVGTWTGAYNPREGAVLYNSADFDVYSINQDGPLPTTPGQRVYLEGERHFQAGPVALMASTRITVQSGTPRDALGDGPDGIVYLIPRGDAGYGPMITQTNLRLGASYRHFDVTLDLFNLFDRRTPTNQDTVYASDSIRPIEGGSYEDLVWLKTDTGATPQRLTTYGVPTEYQAPFSAVLGIHRAF
jgi:hypothetical protein